MEEGQPDMVMEPRFEEEYSDRKVEAAKRALVDIMQVLASLGDCLVLVGGWVPDLLIQDSDEPHIGSIDVDLALDTEKLMDGRYAHMLELLLQTRRYRKGEKDFQLQTTIDLKDDLKPITVLIDFMGAKDAETEKNKPKLIENFRLLKADGCSAAFYEPISQKVTGHMASGAKNSVSIQIVSLPDFLIMKAFALKGRDKPKDAYDICYCLDHYSGGITELANAWKQRLQNDVTAATLAFEYLREAFKSIEQVGPQWVVEFHNSNNPEEREIQARRAYELVQTFLDQVEG